MKLLRFKEKHGYRNFVFETDEDKCKILVKVARERLAEGYWYSTEPKGHPDLFRPTAHLSEAEEIGLWLAKLDNPALRKPSSSGKPVPDEWYIRRIAGWMVNRQDHEYEGMEIESIETP